MRGVIFDVSGKFAHFRKIYTNSSSLTYYVPPRTAVIGMIAGMLGFERDSYYDRLSEEHLRISVINKREIGIITQTLNYIKAESPTGLARFKDHTQIPFEILTSDQKLCYRIIAIFEDKELQQSLKQRLINNCFVFPVSLGTANFCGEVDYVGEYELKEINTDKFIQISSIIPSDSIEGFKLITEQFLVKDHMPVDFDESRKIKKTRGYIIQRKPSNLTVKTSSVAFRIMMLDKEENIMFM